MVFFFKLFFLQKKIVFHHFLKKNKKMQQLKKSVAHASSSMNGHYSFFYLVVLAILGISIAILIYTIQIKDNQITFDKKKWNDQKEKYTQAVIECAKGCTGSTITDKLQCQYNCYKDPSSSS